MLIKLRKRLGTVLENELMSKHATFKIGGPAKYFFDAKDNDQLVFALQAAADLKLNYFILGGGSNILVADAGFDGLVIKLSNCNFRISGTSVYADSGASVSAVLDATLKAGLVGWAWIAGLPGTVGGSIRGNAGSRGESMADIVKSVEIFYQGAARTFRNADMKFAYRHSVVKEMPYVIISAILELKKGDAAKDEALMKSYIEHRVKTQPLDLPNCGCAFKNINLIKTPVDEQRVMRELDVDEEDYRQATKYHKLPVSFIVDHLNLKGKTIGGAQISPKHGAFIVNLGNAKAEQVIMLMSDLKMRVRNQLGIQLEEEIQLVGF